MPQTLITMPEHVYDELKSRVKTLDMLAKGDSVLAQQAQKLAEYWALADILTSSVKVDDQPKRTERH